MNQNNYVRDLVKGAIVAAVYITLTALIQPLAFGQIQFRVSEVLNLLAFYNPVYIAAVTIGCFISNMLFSPYGIFDTVIGTFHTFISLYLIWKSRKLITASVWPAVMSFIVALGISFSAGTWALFIPQYIYIAISEFIIVSLIGVPIFRILEEKGVIDKYFTNLKQKKSVTAR